MTYTFKLARRLAVSRLIPGLVALALVAACQDAATAPEGAPSSTRDAIDPFGVSPHLVTVETNQLVTLRGGASNLRTAPSAGIVWTATGGNMRADGTFSATEPGVYKIVGRGRQWKHADTSVVTVVPPPPDVVRIALLPDSATLAISATKTFTAVGFSSDGSTRSVGVTWSATGGDIDAGGNYTAGAAPGKYTVVATNVAGTLADTASVAVDGPDSAPPAPSEPPAPPPSSPPKIVLTPASVSVQAGATAQFAAYGRNSTGDSITVTVTYAATGGTVTAEGLYSAGKTAGTYRVIAAAAGLADTSPVTVTAPPLTQVVLTPASVSLQTGATAQFAAYGRNSIGDSVSVVVTYAASGGTVSPQGVYTAGQTAGTFRVIAAAGGLADTSQVTVTAPPPPPAPSGSARQYGLHTDLAYYGTGSFKDRAIQEARNLGATIQRSTLPWYDIEKSKGSRNWAKADGTVDQARAAGIETLFFFGSSPQWANGSTDPWVIPTGAAFDQWLLDYRSFIIEAVTRYKGRVSKWELWNEQNEVYFWKPAPNIDQYARFYRMAYDAVKSVDPSAEVSVGGLAGLINGCCISGKAFLQGLYDRGIRPDIVNIHPYALKNQAPDVHLDWESNFDDIAAIRQVMVANGEGSKPMWVTEWGWPSTAVGEATQAAYVAKSLQMIDTLYPYVTVSTYFLEFDQSGYTQGLFDGSFRMKPAGAAFRDFMATH